MKTILVELMVLGVMLLIAALALVPTTQAALPPRPTVPPTPIVEPPYKPVGGWIELRAQNAPGGNVWTIVQWQDALQTWRDVVEWRGMFDETRDAIGQKTWWVEQRDFGLRMRWLVYLETREQVVCESQPFDAPRENKQTVVVPVECK
ncbi:MAG: hypothetical protein HY782_06905 [Chloroflexi bacterium]|nr:hypothetical protein [Chloroflexota bacterium]